MEFDGLVLEEFCLPVIDTLTAERPINDRRRLTDAISIQSDVHIAQTVVTKSIPDGPKWLRIDDVLETPPRARPGKQSH